MGMLTHMYVSLCRYICGYSPALKNELPVAIYQLQNSCSQFCVLVLMNGFSFFLCKCRWPSFLPPFPTFSLGGGDEGVFLFSFTAIIIVGVLLLFF